MWLTRFQLFDFFEAAAMAVFSAEARRQEYPHEIFRQGRGDNDAPLTFERSGL